MDIARKRRVFDLLCEIGIRSCRLPDNSRQGRV
jgi:hypothetical protein